MLITAMLMATALVGSDPDGVVATAPEASVDLGATLVPTAPSVEGAARSAALSATEGLAPQALDTDAQIERWLAAGASGERPGEAGDPFWRDDGEPHGEFSFGIGTGGYRDYGAAISLPLGEHGRLGLSYRQVENGYYRYGYGLGDRYFDESGYVFPGYRPGAAYQFENRLSRPEGPPQLRHPAAPRLIP
jgi:hypothetical protein